ncbi:MAG: hypothetical protein KC621_21255 [Myxococcales bacterium]|nr:hypothetical protein [Myxococcales bacterium]
MSLLSTSVSVGARALALGVLASTVACHPNTGDGPTDAVTTDTDTDDTDTPTTPGERFLSDSQLLTRISLDLVGERPTVDQFERMAADPDSLDAMIDEMLLDPRFERHLEDLFSELFYTRNGDYYVYFFAYVDPHYGGWNEDELVAHIGEEPLRMLSYLAANDLPYTDYVNGNWTVADDVLADLWPLDYPAGVTGWQKASYNDGRPGVGVLGTNSMWWFRGSMENNRNRGRANTVSRIFLCDDYLEREVPFVASDVLNSEDAVGDAINTNPSCTACHKTLDPLASHFYGWWWYFHDKGMPAQIERYHPEREFLWKELTGIAPGYFGQPSNGLVDLGELVSSDPRYSKCFVKHSWELVTRTDADLVEVDLDPIQNDFDDSGMRIREAFRSLVHHPAYQGYDERFALKMGTPELLSSQVAGLTGYWWTRNERDLVNSSSGYTLLAGAADGDQVTSPSATATVTTNLVQQRLAENASKHVTRNDMALSSGRKLYLDELTFTETPGSDDAMVRRQMQALELRVLGKTVATDGPEVDALFELWSQVYASTSDLEFSWSAVVGVLLRDPDLVMY